MSSIAIGYSLLDVSSSPHYLHMTPSNLERESFTLLFESLDKFFKEGIIAELTFSIEIFSIHLHILLRV